MALVNSDMVIIYLECRWICDKLDKRVSKSNSYLFRLCKFKYSIHSKDLQKTNPEQATLVTIYPKPFCGIRIRSLWIIDTHKPKATDAPLINSVLRKLQENKTVRKNSLPTNTPSHYTCPCGQRYMWNLGRRYQKELPLSVQQTISRKQRYWFCVY